jgi:lysophospholipase L1-like esterase
MFDYNLFSLISLLFTFVLFIFLLIYLKRRFTSKKLTKNYYNLRVEQFSCLPPHQQAIVFVGDSLTEMGSWSEFFPESIINNRGIGGDTTTGLFNRIESITTNNPSQIFLMIGINDICLEKKSSKLIIANYRKILDYLSSYPELKVYVQSILPVNKIGVKPFKQVNQQIIEINQELENLAKEFKFEYIDLYSHFVDTNAQLDKQYTQDGIHLTGKGYLLWLEVIDKFYLWI